MTLLCALVDRSIPRRPWLTQRHTLQLLHLHQAQALQIRQFGMHHGVAVTAYVIGQVVCSVVGVRCMLIVCCCSAAAMCSYDMQGSSVPSLARNGSWPRRRDQQQQQQQPQRTSASRGVPAPSPPSVAATRPAASASASSRAVAGPALAMAEVSPQATHSASPRVTHRATPRHNVRPHPVTPQQHQPRRTAVLAHAQSPTRHPPKT